MCTQIFLRTLWAYRILIILWNVWICRWLAFLLYLFILCNWLHLQCCVRDHRLYVFLIVALNRFDSKGNYSATSNNTKLVHWQLMDGLLHLVQQGGAWAGCGPAQSPLAVPNVTAHPSSTVHVPITVLLCDGPLLCGCNVVIKGLMPVLFTEWCGYYDVRRQQQVFILRLYLHLLFHTFLARSVVVLYFSSVTSGIQFC